MAVRLTKSQLPDLLSWLKKYLPDSFKIHEDLKAHLERRYPDLEFYVDRWPDPQAASVVVDPDGEQLEGKKFLENVNLGVFCTNEKALTSLLEDSRLVKWDRPSIICAIPKSHWAVVRGMIEERVGPIQPEPCFLLKVNKESLLEMKVPNGMQVSSLTDEAVAVVDSTWKFSSEGSSLYIRDLVQNNPSVLLTTNEGEHVGHMIGQGYSTMGMLHIMPHFRGKGYSKVIVSQLAAKILDMGSDCVHVLIEEDNEVSLKLHKSMGFSVVPDFQVAYMKFTPKDCKSQCSKCCV